MSLQEIFAGGGLGLFVLLTLIQITPIKVNPWTALARSIGKAFNGDVLKEISDTKAKLENHIRMDDERNADLHRNRILVFNTELLRRQKHTREDFIEILSEIDKYEAYCKAHPEYKNSRCVHAVANISRVYDDLLQTGNFLAD